MLLDSTGSSGALPSPTSTVISCSAATPTGSSFPRATRSSSSASPPISCWDRGSPCEPRSTDRGRSPTECCKATCSLRPGRPDLFQSLLCRRHHPDRRVRPRPGRQAATARASNFATAGVRIIAGDIIGDGSYFTPQVIHPGMGELRPGLVVRGTGVGTRLQRQRRGLSRGAGRFRRHRPATHHDARSRRVRPRQPGGNRRARHPAHVRHLSQRATA